jgi:hypothetical protein
MSDDFWKMKHVYAQMNRTANSQAAPEKNAVTDKKPTQTLDVNTCPERVGEAKAVWYTPVAPHVKRGFPGDPTIVYAVVAQYPGENAAYLFGCTSNWEVITDSWHLNVDDAISSAVATYPEANQSGKFTSNS